MKLRNYEVSVKHNGLNTPLQMKTDTSVILVAVWKGPPQGWPEDLERNRWHQTLLQNLVFNLGACLAPSLLVLEK